jgi:hypothetical protein
MTRAYEVALILNLNKDYDRKVGRAEIQDNPVDC